MSNLILDTNIYGEMVVDKDLDKLKEGIAKKPTLIIFGSRVVRIELRSTPKKIRVGGQNLRIDLLNLYDQLTGKRTILLTSEIEDLAENYYQAYRACGGALGKKAMSNDLLIVGTATLRQLDIVVSNDESSMKSVHARQAYQLVNAIKKLRNPAFMDYAQFKTLLR